MRVIVKSHKLQGSTSNEVKAMNSNEYHHQTNLPEDDEIDLAELWHAIWSVSYTHLTLPTTPYV